MYPPYCKILEITLHDISTWFVQLANAERHEWCNLCTFLWLLQACNLMTACCMSSCKQLSSNVLRQLIVQRAEAFALLVLRI